MVIHRTNTSRLLWNDSFTQIKHQVVIFLVIMISSCTTMDANQWRHWLPPLVMRAGRTLKFFSRMKFCKCFLTKISFYHSIGTLNLSHLEKVTASSKFPSGTFQVGAFSHRTSITVAALCTLHASIFNITELLKTSLYTLSSQMTLKKKKQKKHKMRLY